MQKHESVGGWSLLILSQVSPNTITEMNSNTSPTPYMLEQYDVGAVCIRTYTDKATRFLHPSVTKLAIFVIKDRSAERYHGQYDYIYITVRHLQNYIK